MLDSQKGPNIMLVIGLTGGIGSGKSEVSKILARLGAVVIDADKVGHEAYSKGSKTWKSLIAAFGNTILNSNGEIDRKELGGLVFKDSKALAELNSIVHPVMRRMLKQRLNDLKKKGTQVAVIEAAVLIEAGWTSLVDEVWVTTTLRRNAVERVKARSRLNEDVIKARIRAQLPQKERRKYADVVILNNSDLQSLKKKTESLWRKRIMERREENDKY